MVGAPIDGDAQSVMVIVKTVIDIAQTGMVIAQTGIVLAQVMSILYGYFCHYFTALLLFQIGGIPYSPLCT